jgi:hypothetical protein
LVPLQAVRLANVNKVIPNRVTLENVIEISPLLSTGFA